MKRESLPYVPLTVGLTVEVLTPHGVRAGKVTRVWLQWNGLQPGIADIDNGSFAWDKEHGKSWSILSVYPRKQDAVAAYQRWKDSHEGTRAIMRYKEGEHLFDGRLACVV